MPIIRRHTRHHNRDHGVYITREQLLGLRHRARLANPPRTRPVNTGLLGESPSRKHGHGIEFEEIRPYQPGDEIRHIDWRVTARMGKPYTRQYSEQQQNNVFVALDQRVNMFFGSSLCFKSWLAAAVAVQIGWASVHGSNRLGAAIASDRLNIIATAAPQPALFDFIDLIIEANHCLDTSQESSADFSQLLSETFAATASGTEVSIVSDFHDLDDTNASLLTGIGNKCRLTMLWTVDPLEEALPASGAVGISNGIERARVRLNQATRNRYRLDREQFERRLHDYAMAANADLRRLSTNDSDIIGGLLTDTASHA